MRASSRRVAVERACLRRATGNSNMGAGMENSARTARRRLPARMGAVIFSRMAKVPRVAFLCCTAILSCLFAAGCHHAASDAGLTKMTLQSDWYPQPEHGGFYTALVKGYYKDAGLDVSIQPGGPYVSVEQQVSVGAAQVGMSSSDKILESIADGEPLIAVA